MTLLSFIDPTFIDFAFATKFIPETEFVDFKDGNFLYPVPDDIIFKDLTEPDAEVDDVE
jgi:hypothetical protein